MSQYVVIETVLIDAERYLPRMIRKSTHEFNTWIEAAKFANRRPAFAILNKDLDQHAIQQLMQLPGE